MLTTNMTDPFAQRSFCAFPPRDVFPNFTYHNSSDDNAPSYNQYPGLAFANSDPTNYYVPSTESEYTIHKKLENVHTHEVAADDQKKTLVNTVEPKDGTQRGMGQIATVVENAFNHPVIKTSKIVLKAKGSGKITKPSKVSKVSKIRYV
jgi:hypothetical protein